MKIISIDDRLKDVASLVNNCNCVADVGTDHGYLALYLVQNKICNTAYATDVAVGPLNSAIENIKKYQLEDKIKTILCDGLKKVNNDVNGIVIAGMGGNLMVDILKNRNYDYDFYVLQPNLHHYALRKYLVENNFKIVDEKISFAHKKYYEIIKVVHGNQSLNENQLTFGPINLINRSELFINKWIEVKEKIERVLIDFKGSDEEKNRLLKEINTINEVINGTITN